MATKRFSVFFGNGNAVEEKDRKDIGLGIGDEKIERPKRLSRFFSFPAEESVKESVFEDDNSDADIKIEGKRSRRFSILSRSSSIYTSEEEFSLEGEEPDTPPSQSKDDIATMVFKLFLLPSRQGTKHKRNASTRSAASFKSKPRNTKVKKDKQARVKVTLRLKLFWKHQRGEGSKVDANAETLSLTPSVMKASRKEHHRSSVCDLKFSSISSALSFTSLPHELLALTTEQCSILLHLVRKVSRSLMKQQRLAANFSTNLAHLFARKEKVIGGNKRLSRECRKMLMGIMGGLRELVGRIFLKKAVFMQRSLQLTHDLEEMLSHAPHQGAKKSKAMMEEVNGSETTLVSSPPSENEQRMSIAVEEVNISTTSLLEHQIDIHSLLHTLHILRDDVGVQLSLDAALRTGIMGRCEDVRFPAAINDRVALKRFVAFVDGCLSYLGRRYGEEGRVVRVLEGLAGCLKDGGGS